MKIHFAPINQAKELLSQLGKDKHFITLPKEQADMWEETANECGVFLNRVGDKVGTIGRKMDLDAAWALFHEKVSKVLGN